MMECHHTAIFLHRNSYAPKVGEVIYCRYCEDAVKVISRASEYHINCTDCRYNRSYGTAKLTAYTRAAGHALKRQHRVKVFEGSKLVHTAGKAVGQLAFESLDDPPF